VADGNRQFLAQEALAQHFDHVVDDGAVFVLVLVLGILLLELEVSFVAFGFGIIDFTLEPDVHDYAGTAAGHQQ